MEVTFHGCQPGGHLFLFLTVYLVIAPLEMVKSDHTTLCINLPHLRYRDENLKTLGMEYFPQNKEFWKTFQEKIIAGAIEGSDLNDFRAGLPGTVSHPRGGLHIYRINSKIGESENLLNGWYRVEFWMKVNQKNSDLHDALKVLIIHVEDDQDRRHSIGEFSLQFPTDNNNCPPNDATKYMLLSCGGASRTEPLVSNVIFLVRNNSEVDEPNGIVFPPEAKKLQEPVVTNLKGKHSLNFYIRIPIQDCNQHRHLVFRAVMIIDVTVFDAAMDGYRPEQLKEDFYRITSTYMTIARDEGSVPGASAALPTRSHSKYLDCSVKLTKRNLPWFGRFDQTYDDNFIEYAPQGPYYYSYTHGCQGPYFKGRCFHNMYTLVHAYAKTVNQVHHQNVAEENQIPLCDTQLAKPSVPGEGSLSARPYYYYPPKKYNSKEVEFLKTHDYLHQFSSSCNTTYNGDPSCNISKVVIDVKSRMLLETRARGRSIHMQRRRLRLLGFNEYHPFYYSCAIPERNLSKYTGNNCTAVWDNITGLGFHTEGFHRLLWGMRRGHALLMAIAFLFVLPVNLFVTRYFKESFMSKRVLYSRIWYQVHVHGTFLLAVLMIAGMGIAYIGEFYLGTSLTQATTSHRAIGWITFVLFIVMTVLGGFRGYNDPLRKITIIIHWALGLFFYFLMAVQMLTGVLIPGNGVASNDPSMCEYDRIAGSCAEQKSPIISGAFLHIFVWIFIEVVMHIVMMFFIMVSDKQMVIVNRRIFFPVLIPVVKEHSKVNAFGHSIRVILLCVYIFLALSSTSMYIIAYITYTNSLLKGLGPMGATHAYNSTTGELFMKETLGDI